MISFPVKWDLPETKNKKKFKRVEGKTQECVAVNHAVQTETKMALGIEKAQECSPAWKLWWDGKIQDISEWRDLVKEEWVVCDLEAWCHHRSAVVFGQETERNLQTHADSGSVEDDQIVTASGVGQKRMDISIIFMSELGQCHKSSILKVLGESRKDRNYSKKQAGFQFSHGRWTIYLSTVLEESGHSGRKCYK